MRPPSPRDRDLDQLFKAARPAKIRLGASEVFLIMGALEGVAVGQSDEQALADLERVKLGLMREFRARWPELFAATLAEVRAHNAAKAQA